MTISPFFLKFRTEVNPPPPVIVQPAPAPTTPVQPAPKPVEPTPAPATVDLGPLTSRVDALEKGQAQLAGNVKTLADGLTAANSALNKLANTPITFVTHKPDGTATSVDKKLGDSVDLEDKTQTLPPAPAGK